MQFIRLPKLLDIAERELPELVADWMNMKSVQNINIYFVQQPWLNMLISGVINRTTSWMPHWHMFRNFRHGVWVIWDLCNHHLFWIIPDPGSQKRITLSLESITTIPFQAATSNVEILEWGQQCSNNGMACLISICGTLHGTWNQPKNNAGELSSCTADILSNITNSEIQQPGQLIVWKLVNWVLSDAHMTGTIDAPAGSWSCISNHQSPVFVPLYIWPLSESARHTSSTLECTSNGKMCQKELNTFESIPVV